MPPPVLDQISTHLGHLREQFAQAKCGPPPKPRADAAKAAAKAAIEAAEAKGFIPASLSGIPGARTGATTVHDQMGAMDAHNLAAAMNGMSEKQVEAFLNRQI